MTRGNEKTFQDYVPDKRLLARLNGVVDIARAYLPEGVKVLLKKVLGRTNTEHMIGKIVSINIQGIEAYFKLQTSSCISRIVGNNDERPFGNDLIETLSQANSPVFYDIGSAQGIYSIPAALLGATVYAFDPDPLSAELFATNLNLNPEAQARTEHFKYALGDRNDTLELHCDAKGTYAPSLQKTSAGLVDTVLVGMTTVDELIEKGKIAPPTVVKIDVEGAEELVLRGMRRLLGSKNRPSNFFIEIHTKYSHQFGSSGKDVVAVLRSFGYTEKKVWQRNKDFLCHFVCTEN